MRLSSTVSLFALGGLLLLAGCDDPSAPSKSTKNPAALGRADVVLKIAHASESSGDLTNAERLYKQAVSIGEATIEPRQELAEFYHRHHRDPEAITTLNDALKLDPKNVALMRETANIHINDGQPDKALALLDSAVAIDGKDAFLYNSRGVALDMLGNYRDAQKSYATALEIDPGNTMTFKANLSMSYILSRDYNDAISLLVPLLDMPDVTPTIRQNLALAYGLKGDNTRALQMGLKDLPMEEARENLKFYRMIAGKNAKTKKISPASLPVSINEIFPEETPETKAVAVPVKTVTINDTAPPLPLPVARPLPAPPVAPSPPEQKTEVPSVDVQSMPMPKSDEPGESVPSPMEKNILPVAEAPPAPPAPVAAPAAPPSAPPSAPDTSGAPSAGWVLPAPVLRPNP